MLREHPGFRARLDRRGIEHRAPLKEVAEWAGNCRRFWDESYELLDEYLEHMKNKERNHGHGK